MANFDWRSVLCEMLDCGYLDLQILDDAEEDFVLEAIEDCKHDGVPITLNTITDTMFFKAQMEINAELDARLDELGSDKANGYAGKEEITELEALRGLDPNEDIHWYCNCLDTGIYILNDRYDTYFEYFGDILRRLEDRMGFQFSE